MNTKNKFLTYKGAVQSQECDSNGHMNVMFYINKFELAGRNSSAEFGLTNHFLQESNFGIAVIEQLIHYKKEVYADDLLHVMSAAKGFTNKVFEFEHELWCTNRKELSAVMKIKLVILDLSKRRAVILPDQIKSGLDKLLSG